MPNMLLISDNPDFRQDLTDQITLYAPDFAVFEEEDEHTVFDVVVLDEKPELLKELRAHQIKSPVIHLLSAEDNNIEESPLNIIIFKPLSLNEFLNQLKSSIYVLENRAEGYLCFNNYELRPSSKEILNLRNKELIKLTEKEVAIIRYLYKAQNKIVSKNELLQEVWGYSPDVTTHTIETRIYRLRQKVEHDDLSAQLIVTEDGGYKLKF